MMKKIVITLFLLLILDFALGKEKRPLTMDDIVKWERLSKREISPDGSFIAVQSKNWLGHSTLKLYNSRGKTLFSTDSVSNLSFSNSSGSLYFRKKGVDGSYTVGVYSTQTGLVEYSKGVIADTLLRLPYDAIALHKSDSTMALLTHKGEESLTSSKLSLFARSGNGQVVATAQKGAIVLYNIHNSEIATLFRGSEKVKRLILNYSGTRAAFVTDSGLYLYWPQNGLVERVADKCSDNKGISFSRNGLKLYYWVPTQERYRGSDKMKGQLHIWNWQSRNQFTEELVRIEEGKSPAYPVVYNLKSKRNFTISQDSTATVSLIGRGNSPIVVVRSDIQYRKEKMWGNSALYDCFLVDTQQERVVAKIERSEGRPLLSPKGEYLYWYSRPDSSWVIYSIATNNSKIVTPPSVIEVYDVDDDHPELPPSYGTAGWSSDDSAFFVYDKYDMWEIDPKGNNSPKNLTINGKNSNVTYRYLPFGKRKIVDFEKSSLLHGFNNSTKGSGYYLLSSKGASPKELIKGDFMLDNAVKASKSDCWIFTKESYSQFPEVHYSANLFKSTRQITHTNPQQDQFLWGEAQLVKWQSKDGKRVEGMLFKPHNWDPKKRYPVIVNFYDRRSNSLHSYRMPEPHRSTIDYHLYNSDGYIIFQPDVHYSVGHPGQSAYNCVIPGVEMLIEEGIAHPNGIGAQGHSWGGYQVAYLATKSALFSAIESGAPVVNMFSAYGGIRWGSGRSRTHQYERGQSRIGKTPWEAPELYFENSPLFSLDRVVTPILIHHNDNDGHVPWYQGIEFFLALKRLQKPVWLLNYTGEIHWPMKIYKRVDFQIRMKQFFDHYLRGEAIPDWMEPGLSAIELGVSK